MQKRVQTKGLFVLAAGAVAGIVPVAAHAATISSGNSSLTINPNSPGSYVSGWTIDGVNQFGGTPAGGDQLQFFNGSTYVNLNTLHVQSSSFVGPISSVTYSTVFDGDNFTINVKDILTGGVAGSGASGITETITVNNLGPAQQFQGFRPQQIDDVTFTIRDVVDYSVNGTSNDDALTLSPGINPNTAVQTDSSGAQITYAATPTPSGFQLIDDGFPLHTDGPRTGNEAFSFDWNLSVAPGNSGIISITEAASGPVASVPLPSAAWSCLSTLGGLGAFGLFKRIRRSIG